MKVVLKIAYDGRAFFGFQRQSQNKTVQGCLEAALTQILQKPVTLQGAGRTDQGVHASGQVVAFSCDGVPSLRRLCRSLNSLLRDPITVVEAAALDNEDPFHPRYSAVARTYSYYLLTGCGPREARFWSGRLWCIPCSLSLESTIEAASIFLGEHDFSTFSYKADRMESRIRNVSQVDVVSQEAPGPLDPDSGSRLIRITISANGFLRRMVRLITSGIVEVGSGRRRLDDLRTRLMVCDPSQAPLAAPPDGLYLEGIDYQPDPFELTRGTSRHALADLSWQHRVR